MENKIIVAFHTGRGGRFFNPGHVTYIGENNINDFTDDLFDTYENQSELFKMIQDKPNLLEKYYQCCDNENFDWFKNRIKFDVGKKIYTDCGGNPVGLDVDNDGTGVINIDNEYNTTAAYFIEECDPSLIELIVNDKQNYKSNELEQWLRENTDFGKMFNVYDKETGEIEEGFYHEVDARDFVISNNAGYGYEKLYYKFE